MHLYSLDNNIHTSAILTALTVCIPVVSIKNSRTNKKSKMSEEPKSPQNEEPQSPESSWISTPERPLPFPWPYNKMLLSFLLKTENEGSVNRAYNEADLDILNET